MLAKNINHLEDYNVLSNGVVDFGIVKYQALINELVAKNSTLKWHNNKDYQEKDNKAVLPKIKSELKTNKSKKPTNTLELIMDKAMAAYPKLRVAMLAGELWAHKIYQKWLSPEITQDTVVIDNSKDELEAHLKALNTFTKLTYEELLAEIKVLRLIKINQKVDQALTEANKEALLGKIASFLKNYQQ